MKATLPVEATLNSISQRHLADGGFCEHPGGAYRADATAWAVLCLKAYNRYPELVSAAQHMLCKSQLSDGSIPLTPNYPEAYWTTAVASLALAGTPDFAANHRRSLNFLLTTHGDTLPKDPGSPLGHDTAIQGWSWIQGTHSWVEPTAMALHTLSSSGESNHARVRQGVRLLLDRQLPHGGWNYGNTTVYGQTLHPMPGSSGTALWALAGLTHREQVDQSLNYLLRQLPRLNTPGSLGWAILGLRAWETELPESDQLIATSLQQQDRYSPYGTSQLSVLLAAAVCKRNGFCL